MDLGLPTTAIEAPVESADTQNGRRSDPIPKRRARRASAAKSQNNTMLAIACYIITVVLIAIMVYETDILVNNPSLLYSTTFNEPDYIMTAAFSLLMPAVAFSYMFAKGNTLAQIIDSVGLDPKRLSLKLLTYGIIIFAVVFVFEIALTLFQFATNIQINTNTQLILAGAPLWFLVFATIISPINEEIFFRGFLIRGIAHVHAVLFGMDQNFDANQISAWVGIIFSALLFGLAHSSYDSSFGIDMIAAGLFAILAGYVYKKTKSIYPTMLAHMLVNALAVVAFIA